MLTIDELFNDLGKASWFTKLDFCQGFHEILMVKEDIAKTVFRTHHGHYEYHIMPFGLSNTPSTFQTTMNAVLQPFLCQFAVVFFNDILVYSESLQTHLNHRNWSSIYCCRVNSFLSALSVFSPNTNWNIWVISFPTKASNLIHQRLLPWYSGHHLNHKRTSKLS